MRGPETLETPRKSVTNQSAFVSCNAMKTADMAHAETIKRFGRVGSGDGGVGALGFSEGKQVPSISPLWLENIP